MTEEDFERRVQVLKAAFADVAEAIPAQITLEFEPLENLYEAQNECLMRLVWACEKVMRPYAKTDPNVREIWHQVWRELDEFCEDEENPLRLQDG